LGLPRAVALHAAVHARTLLDWRRLTPWLVVTALVAVVAFALARLPDLDPTTLQDLLGELVLRGTGLCALGLGVSAIREDIEAGAMPLLLLRPRAAFALPAGRWLAVGGIVAGLGMAMTLLVAAALAAKPAQPDGRTVAVGLLAALAAAYAYSGLFMAVGAWFRSATGAALGWFVAIDVLLAQFSTRAAALSPATLATQMLHGLQPAGLDAAPPSPDALGALVWMAVLGLAGCALTIARLRRGPLH
jgi:hypothetical protein